MGYRIQIIAVAVGLVLLGIAILLYRRRAVRCPRYRKPVGVIASLAAYGSLVAALVLVVLVWFFPRNDEPSTSTRVEASSSPASEPTVDSAAKALSPDERTRQQVIGAWTDNYRGKRTMTLRENGTGTMIVELTGWTATLYAKRLQFEMTWRVQDGRLIKQTIGGEPAGKVQLILKAMGDRADEQIQELTRERLVLLDQNGTTTYNWTRIE